MRLFGGRGSRYLASATAVVGLLAVMAPQAIAETVPTAPSNVRITAIGVDYVDLSFVDRSTNEDEFAVERRQVPNGSFAKVKSVRDHRTGQPQATGWTIQTRASWGFAFYCYRVKAVNEAGAGSSAEVCPPRPDLRFNGSPTQTPLAGPAPGQAFTISWTACNYGGAPTGNFTDTATFDDDLTSERTVSSLLPGACYTRSVSHLGVPAGTYHWDLRLDRYNWVYESSETNNTKVYEFNVGH